MEPIEELESLTVTIDGISVTVDYTRGSIQYRLAAVNVALKIVNHQLQLRAEHFPYVITHGLYQLTYAGGDSGVLTECGIINNLGETIRPPLPVSNLPPLEIMA